jgi:hypothetical protein
MRIGSRASFMAVAAVVVGVTACLGTDPSPSSAPPGQLSGACYANGTCNAGLECRAGACELAADGGGGRADAASDAPPGGDATPDAAPDAPSCGAVVATPGAGPTCPLGGVASAVCGGGQQCCALANDVACQSPCNVQPQDTVWACTAPSHCPAGGCCLDPAARVSDQADRCPRGRVESAASATCPGAPCVAGSVALCVVDRDCNGKSCVPSSVNMGGTLVVLGLCL